MIFISDYYSLTTDVANDPVLLKLRQELYADGTVYEKVDWDRYRQTCADIDVYSPLNPVMKVSIELSIHLSI